MKEQEMLNRISIINVKNKLQLQEIYSTSEIIYVKCPFCNCKQGVMKLNTFNNSYICRNCEKRGYSIGLYAKCNVISNKEAFKDLIAHKADVRNNLKSSLVVNTKKNEDELDNVYQYFLSMLTLTSEHTNKLLKLGFSLQEIESIGFKSIPTNEQEKVKICQKLIQEGFELSGVPGYYQDNTFNWNFKSHKGIFVPVVCNCKIIGLRIHLDNAYNTDTTDIWFSSNNKNNGTKASNSIMILLPKQNRLQLINNNKEHKDIIVVSEMMLAYKIHCKYTDKIVVGVPNVISKSEIIKLDKIKNINHVYVVMETHSILHSSELILSNLIKIYGEENISLSISLKNCHIPESLDSMMESYMEKLA